MLKRHVKGKGAITLMCCNHAIGALMGTLDQTKGSVTFLSIHFPPYDDIKKIPTSPHYF